MGSSHFFWPCLPGNCEGKRKADTRVLQPCEMRKAVQKPLAKQLPFHKLACCCMPGTVPGISPTLLQSHPQPSGLPFRSLRLKEGACLPQDTKLRNGEQRFEPLQEVRSFYCPTARFSVSKWLGFYGVSPWVFRIPDLFHNHLTN